MVSLFDVLGVYLSHKSLAILVCNLHDTDARSRQARAKTPALQVEDLTASLRSIERERAVGTDAEGRLPWRVGSDVADARADARADTSLSIRLS